MTLFKLRKRLADKEKSPTLELPTLAVAEVDDAPKGRLNAVPSTVSLMSAEVPPLESPAAPAESWSSPSTLGHRLPESWKEDVQDETLRLIAHPTEVLVLGLRPWTGTSWSGKLKRRATSVVTVDPDAARLVEWRQVAEVRIQAALESLTWSQMLIGRRFGAVVLGDALTHQADPLHFLGRVRDVLAQNGSVVGVVPNATWGENRLKLLQGELPRGYEPGSALHRYNRDRLREALAFAGYALVELYTHRTPFFEGEESVTPELFPDTVLQTLDPHDDATVSHLVFRAVPATPDDMLRSLFQEQEDLKRSVRNELTRAKRACDALSEQLATVNAHQDTLISEMADQRATISGISERAARLEQNLRSMTEERDRAWRELNSVRQAWWYRLFGGFRRSEADD
ncbi:MAG: methyltransferase domain-containing protein [Candidatus Sericytochromatia bacterium]|nr:methyltransferase domain-containing protein [Candidatus Sericytochromatia bacterium]